jgi:peptidoglycan/xylan/chitin deacetylase (PgdA/CDA1 family)
VRSALASAVKVAAAAADRVRPPARGAVVLIYHRVGRRSATPVDLPTDLFRRQVEWIAASARATTLDAALEVVAGSPGPVPAPDPLVVTFDDGTADFAEVALPVLAEHGVPATLYLATDHVERSVPFPNDGQPLSWPAVRDALSTGLVTVGSHTHCHHLLDRTPVDEVAADLDHSIGLIAERCGTAARHFAYPKGLLGSPEAEAAVRARFRSAALGGTRPNPYGRTDPHRLARSPVQVSDGMRWFEHKAKGGLGLEDLARGYAARYRYASATR